MFRKLKILLFLQLMAILFSPIAFGVEFNRISISPFSFEGMDKASKSWFVYRLKQGSLVENGVVIQNKNADSTTVELYAVDATTTVDGAFTLKNEGEIEGAGGWIKLAKRKITIPGNSKETVSFSLKVPSKATPGDHVAGIAVVPVVSDLRQETGLKVVNRVGIRFYINVEGKVKEDLTLSSLKIIKMGGENYLSYSLTNDGNTNLSVKAETGIKSPFGFQNLNLGNIGEVLAGKTVKREVKIPKIKPFPLFVDLDLAYGTANKKLIGTVVVWENIAILTFAGGVLTIAFIYLIRRNLSRSK